MTAISNTSLLVVVFTVTFFSGWITTMVFSFLPKLVRWFGVATLDVGLNVGFVGTSIYIGAFLSSPVWGYLTDKLGYRACVFLTSGFCVLTTVSKYFCGRYIYTHDQLNLRLSWSRGVLEWGFKNFVSTMG